MPNFVRAFNLEIGEDPFSLIARGTGEKVVRMREREISEGGGTDVSSVRMHAARPEKIRWNSNGTQF